MKRNYVKLSRSARQAVVNSWLTSRNATTPAAGNPTAASEAPADTASGATLMVKALSSHGNVTIDGGSSAVPPGKDETQQQQQQQQQQAAEEGSLQKEMLKDPRFGSPLLCDAVVMLLALVPLLCGLQEFFTAKLPANSSMSGFHYGLILCGIFIFLLGLRSASLHLINRADTKEERVLYILEKYGGSVWIPAMPKIPKLPDGSGSGVGVGGVGGGGSGGPPGETDQDLRLLLDPETRTGYLFSSRRESSSTIDQLDQATNANAAPMPAGFEGGSGGGGGGGGSSCFQQTERQSQ